MTRDPLENLIAEADALAGGPRVDTGLAARIPALAARRRRRRTALGIGTAAVITLASGAMVLHLTEMRTTHPQPPSVAWHNDQFPAQRVTPLDARIAPAAARPSAGELKARIAQLEAEARAREAVIGELLALERRDRVRGELAALQMQDPSEPIREQAERAAFITLAQGDRFRAYDHAAAADSYRQVVQLFPDTPAAASAQARLNSLRRSTPTPTHPAPQSLTEPPKGHVL